MLTGPVSCNLLWTRACLLLSLKGPDGVVCSAVSPLCLEVKNGIGIVPWRPVCRSHVSAGDTEEHIYSLTFIRHMHTTGLQYNCCDKQHKNTHKHLLPFPGHFNRIHHLTM